MTNRLVIVAVALVLSLRAGNTSAESTLTPYPLVPGDTMNPDFQVKVNGTLVAACLTVMNVGYTHFAFTGTARVEISAREPVTSFDISPHRNGIAAKAEDNALSFELSESRMLHIQVNGLKRFFLFAEAPESSLPDLEQADVFSVASFGMVSSPDEVQTAKIQRAIDEVAAKRGVLMVPPGIYRTGELRMKSHITIYLAPGAILKGTGRIADHPRGEFGTQRIHFIDCQNVHIRGRGVIDGQGLTLRLAEKNSSGSRMKLIRAFRARNCSVEGIVLRDSGTWTAHLIESSDLRFSHVKLISNTTYDDPTFP